ncbi:MAG: IS1380 family transposase [Actinomycetales bacterium]|nr:IS1380 family transposase [Actinomycetales bacterium]
MTVEVAGRGVVAHTGSVALRVLADRMGLSAAMSSALARRDVVPVHDRGRVLADAAVMIADGGRVMSDLAVLRDQGELFGPVASDPTLWRTLDAVDARTRDRLAAARARTRRHVWSQITARHGAIPASKVADRDLGRTIVVRLDATLVIAHSEKDLAAGTFKGTWGHHPLTAWCDNTGESLAVKLRTGSAGSNTVADHLEVLTAALTQIPGSFRRDLLITCDGAGATKDLLAHITTLNAAPGRRVGYSVGFDLDERCRTAIGRVPEALWENVISHDGSPRDLDDAGVVELTGLLRESVGAHGRNDGRTIDQLKTWPKDMRVIVRRERPHPGAQLSLFEEVDGWRYQVFATNTPTSIRGTLGQLAYLEARHRAHARVEDCIRNAKNTGLGHLPSKHYKINQVWCIAAAIACDLLAWLRLLCLTGPLAKAEPKTLRYRLLHTAARLIRGQRRRKIRIPETWPWATELASAITAALTLSLPA